MHCLERKSLLRFSWNKVINYQTHKFLRDNTDNIILFSIKSNNYLKRIISEIATRWTNCSYVWIYHKHHWISWRLHQATMCPSTRSLARTGYNFLIRKILLQITHNRWPWRCRRRNCIWLWRTNYCD
jgi:hypothetical protein